MTRRGRDGEPLDDELSDLDLGPHRCHYGWAGEDPTGRPIPCPVCRPHLTHKPSKETP